MWPYEALSSARSWAWTLPNATMPPAAGQDTEKVLRDLLGLDANRLAQLKRDKMI